MQNNINLRDKNAINVFINVLDNIKKDTSKKTFKNYERIKFMFIKQFNYNLIGIVENKKINKIYDEFIFAIERKDFRNKIYYVYSNNFLYIGFGFNGKTITISFLPVEKSNGEWDMRYKKTMKSFLKELSIENYHFKEAIDDYHLKDIENINEFM
ncbi:MAG: hypothetical protein B6I28_00425 [Fusobacteriia bacterium 4572_132]|nr:MAG: hypothetical protein B6I28_00425 [Fusobacteriia bacterium 4572_132]